VKRKRICPFYQDKKPYNEGNFEFKITVSVVCSESNKKKNKNKKKI